MSASAGRCKLVRYRKCEKLTYYYNYYYYWLCYNSSEWTNQQPVHVQFQVVQGSTDGVTASWRHVMVAGCWPCHFKSSSVPKVAPMIHVESAVETTLAVESLIGCFAVNCSS